MDEKFDFVLLKKLLNVCLAFDLAGAVVDALVNEEKILSSVFIGALEGVEKEKKSFVEAGCISKASNGFTEAGCDGVKLFVWAGVSNISK